MAVKFFSEVGEFIFQRMEQPTDHKVVTSNNFRASIWGTMGSGGTALVSFIFSRYLIQNEPWKSIAPHVVIATLWGCGTFAAAAVYLVYKAINNTHTTDASWRPLSRGVSLIAKRSALVGLIGAAAAALATHYVQESSLAKHSFVALQGLGVAGSILWIFTLWQNKQLETFNHKVLEGLEVT
jgi:hypothetical protein